MKSDGIMEAYARPKLRWNRLDHGWRRWFFSGARNWPLFWPGCHGF